MYIVGFAETVRDVMREYDYMIIDSGMNDVRIIGLGKYDNIISYHFSFL